MIRMHIQARSSHLHHKYLSVPPCRRNSFAGGGHSLLLLSAYSSKCFQVLREQWLKGGLSICAALGCKTGPFCRCSFCIIHWAILNPNQCIAVSEGVRPREEEFISYLLSTHLILTWGHGSMNHSGCTHILSPAHSHTWSVLIFLSPY